MCIRDRYDWKERVPPISQALKKGKEIVDIQVENALLKRALGYEYMEERVEISEKDGRKVIQTTKTALPDTTALIFWLKNRRPDAWRDKPQEKAEAAGEGGGVVLLPAVAELREPGDGP